MLDLISEFMPRCYNLAVMVCSAVIGALSYAVGGIDVAVQWLLTFVALDYILGTFAACKKHGWSSSAGFRGIIKKVVIFMIVCLCNGLDQIIGSSGALRSAAILAYSVNEVGSILENLARLGYTGLIPAALQNSIKAVKLEKEEDKK